MQNELNRPSQKHHTIVKIPEKQVLAAIDSAVENALILNPSSPANQIPDLADIEPEHLAELALLLCHRYLTRRARAIRRKLSPPPTLQPVLPGFDALPSAIPAAKGGTVELLDATYTDAREFYWGLIREWNDAKNNDPLVIQARKFMDDLQPYASEKKITARQVFRLKGFDIPEGAE